MKEGRALLPSADSTGTTQHQFYPLRACLLTEMGMTDGLQQSFPLSHSLLLIPLTFEGYTGARSKGCRKVAIAGERENALCQRFTVTRRVNRNRSLRDVRTPQLW
jgi:hypothetical protein